MNETWNQEPAPKLISYQFWFFIFFEINFSNFCGFKFFQLGSDMLLVWGRKIQVIYFSE